MSQTAFKNEKQKHKLVTLVSEYQVIHTYQKEIRRTEQTSEV